MPKKQHVRVIKVPLSRDQRPVDRPAAFPRMSRLYLELIENKAKIKQDLINKEYVPDHSDSPAKLNFIDNSPKDDGDRPRRDRRRDRDWNNNSDRDSPRSDDKDDDFEKRLERLLERKSDDSDKGSPSYSDSDADTRTESSEVSVHERRDSDDRKQGDSDSDSSDDLSVRLKELLNDTDSESDASRSASSSGSFDRFQKSLQRSEKEDKYSRHRDKHGHTLENAKSPPTLAELEARGAYQGKKELRDVNYVTMSEQEEEDAKRELMFKFQLLQKSYPTSEIPEYTIHSDYHTMKKSYDMCVRRLSLDSSVEQYKTYLIGLFMGSEFIFGNFLGFDMQGFTQQQIINMHSYEKLLIELGEKSYVPSGSRWPVELRLLFLVLMNTAFFLISKALMKKTGANLLGMINSMNTTPTAAVPAKPKRRMRGPTIDVDDIPDAEPALGKI